MTIEWLAGFFDGEGCVRLEPHQDGYYLYPRLILTQKDRQILRLVQSEFGGKLYRKSASGCSAVNWYGAEAIRMAERLLPFSYCKRPQLLTLIEAHKVPAHSRAEFRERMAAQKKDIET